MDTAVYETLEASDVSWYYCICGIPNFNTSLFEVFLLSSSNRLHTTISSISSDCSLLDTSNIGLPRSTSSPTSRKRQPLSKRKLRTVSINFQSLKSKNAKYLGVLISDTLSWNTHVDTVTKKTNNTTGFLGRNLSNCPQCIKDTCCKTFVRPQLEYAATVWDSHTDIHNARQ